MTRSIHLMILGVVSALLVAGQASATLISIPGVTGAQTFVDYGDGTIPPVGTVIDGGTFGGVLHAFSVGGAPSLDAIINGGPGNTNNITFANIEGNALGVLSLSFALSQVEIGFGYALLSGTPGLSGVTVELFDALDASLGSLSFVGFPDPGFIGGFAGVASSIPFLRAEVSFNAAPSRFAFDNLQLAPIPEPSGVLLFSVGMLVVGAALRRQNG